MSKIFKYLGFLVVGYVFLMVICLMYTGDITFEKEDFEIFYPDMNKIIPLSPYSQIYSNSSNSSSNKSYSNPVYAEKQTKEPDPPSAEWYNQTYTWSYDGYTTEYFIGVPGSTYDYYKKQSHTSRNFDQYALSGKDQPILNQIVSRFEEMGNKRGYTKDENAMHLIAFVQSMTYTNDSMTTGYDEYPRYPIETLADGGGDCEDTAILAAALLREMGYGVVLLEFPHHMALGIAGSENIIGSYYEYNGTRYFYVETTAEGYHIGEVPPEIDSSKAKIHPMKKIK